MCYSKTTLNPTPPFPGPAVTPHCLTDHILNPWDSLPWLPNASLPQHLTFHQAPQHTPPLQSAPIPTHCANNIYSHLCVLSPLPTDCLLFSLFNSELLSKAPFQVPPPPRSFSSNKRKGRRISERLWCSLYLAHGQFGTEQCLGSAGFYGAKLG